MAFEYLTTGTQATVANRCKDAHPISDGLECPHCGAQETYKNPHDPENTELWAFVIRAFRVDNHSQCMNCNNWF